MINKAVQNEFSHVGLSLTVFGLLTTGLQFVLGAILGIIAVFRNLSADSMEDVMGELTSYVGNSNYLIILSMITMYVIGLPVLILMLRKVRAYPPEKHALGFGRAIRLFLICITVMMAGSLLGNAINHLISGASGAEIDNTTIDLVSGSNLFVAIIFVVIIGPFFEELIFRKFMIDRLRIFGERQIMILSGIMFGLFHGNLYQLFYAAALGIILGYIYLRTGRMVYTWVFHMLINFLFGIVPMFLLTEADIDVEALLQGDISALTSDAIGAAIFGWTEIVLAIVGFVLLLIYARKMVFQVQPYEIPKGLTGKTVYRAPGVLAFLICYGLTIFVSIGGLMIQAMLYS